MNKFKECKNEWLKYTQEKERLESKIVEKIKIILDKQKEIGFEFPFPFYKSIDIVKTHHWFFHRIESESKLECPCCKSLEISDSYVRIVGDYFDIYECLLCGYLGIKQYIQFPNYTIHSYSSSLSSFRILNSQLDKYLNK